MSDAVLIETYEAAKLYFYRCERMWVMGLLEYEGMERAENRLKSTRKAAQGALSRTLGI